jgi:hypothetical protein
MHRILIISLALAMAVILLLPAVAAASGPAGFSANGDITGISRTEVGLNAFPLGNSGNWRVVDREITGSLTGDLVGEYTLTYEGVFDIRTQAGCFTGILKSGDCILSLNGKVSPLTFSEMGAPKLEINGHWKGTSGIHAKGDFSAWLIFLPDVNGHIETILASSFSMSGKYQGKK